MVFIGQVRHRGLGVENALGDERVSIFLDTIMGGNDAAFDPTLRKGRPHEYCGMGTPFAT
ncbi:hypothetical protein RE428_09340 [Marinobacter nanhaiticus D15-8W]|nr:hypothetical protein RE428_09340 [Marinobacter nanhaiticus D15-8W]